MTGTPKNDFTKRTKGRGNEAKIYTKWRHVEDKVVRNSAHDGCEDPGARIMSCRRRWGEGCQNTALIGAEELDELLGELTFGIICSKLREKNLARPSSAARQLKVARPQPRSPAPRADPEGQFVYK